MGVISATRRRAAVLMTSAGSVARASRGAAWAGGQTGCRRLDAGWRRWLLASSRMATTRPSPAELQEVLDSARGRHRVPGAAAGVVLGARSLIATSGVTSVEDPLPVDAATLFMVGSTTKTFTATAPMRPVDRA